MPTGLDLSGVFSLSSQGNKKDVKLPLSTADFKNANDILKRVQSLPLGDIEVRPRGTFA